MHHTEGHPIANRTLWRGLISLCTVGVALVLYRAANIPLIGAIIAAFAVTIAFAAGLYLLRVHGHNDGSNQ